MEKIPIDERKKIAACYLFQPVLFAAGKLRTITPYWLGDLHESDYLKLRDLAAITKVHAFKLSKVVWPEKKFETLTDAIEMGRSIAFMLKDDSYPWANAIDAIDMVRSFGYATRCQGFSTEDLAASGFFKIVPY